LHFFQHNAPVFEALAEYKQNRMVHFDVPGHKGGRANRDLTEFLGDRCMSADINSSKPVDNLCHPVSVIRDAEILAAEAFGAANAFFMVGGTTSSVQAMIMTACKRGDSVIMPRNVHRSAINALVICGAVPVYINPGLNKRLGIPLGMMVEDVKRAIKENPGAKAVFLNNPTYYGICSNLREITALAHTHGMLVLVDEAHGAHFYFGDGFPIPAMAVGADMAAVSMHKTGGSLTQSSFLLCGKDMNAGYVRQIINLTQTTSGSYLLLASLDMSRSHLAMQGTRIYKQALSLAEYARVEINEIGGYYAFSRELCDGDAIYDFDATKLSVHTRDIGLAGVEVYDLLRDEYGIQIEFGDIGNILALITAADRGLELERLISSLSEIKRLYQKDSAGMFDHEYISPAVRLTPQEAFYSEKKSLPTAQTAGCICGEFVMCYPPGIPILAPGERITREILDYIAYAKEKGCFLTGTQDMDTREIQVLI
jgi:arginine/lysine/ornithine decarboxylase